MGAVFRNRRKVAELDWHLTSVCHLASDKGVRTMTVPLVLVGFVEKLCQFHVTIAVNGS